MRKLLALLRASWLEASSYRVKTALSLVGVVVALVPFYFAARALQSVMADSIQTEGNEYFSFLIIGMVVFAFMRTAVGALPDEVGGAISTGTLEALLGTPTPIPVILTGLVSYAFSWTSLRVLAALVFAWFMGMQVLWSRIPLALAILALVTLAHIGFGLMAAALIIAFRAAGPLQSLIIWISTMLGGVYYPTSVIPEWLQQISVFVPLTYGVRALRRALLEPAVSYEVLARDLLPLAGMTVLLLFVSAFGFSRALRYARHAGTLAQY